MKESSIIICRNCGNTRYFYNEVMKKTVQFLESVRDNEILLAREDNFENKNGTYICSTCHSQAVIIPSKLFNKQQILTLVDGEDSVKNIKIIEEIVEKQQGKGDIHV